MAWEGEEIMSKTLQLRPIMTEKVYGQSETLRTYAFSVPGSANKHAVADAVVAQFEVTPTDVRITNIKGKKKRTVRKGGRAVTGRRSDVKKAYVTLKEGDSLPFFASVKEEQEKEQKAVEKAAKAAAKEKK
jgi:large subunit ribosomal protein L23